MNILEITWTADPAIFTIGSREIRWYALAFLLGFYIGYRIVQRMWKQENLDPSWLDPLLYYTVGGTIFYRISQKQSGGLGSQYPAEYGSVVKYSVRHCRNLFRRTGASSQTGTN